MTTFQHVYALAQVLLLVAIACIAVSVGAWVRERRT